MKVTKYKNLYQLTWAPMLFPINCYLWENDDDIIVIDMGVKSFVSEIKKIAERLNKPISALLLTHAHADHVNGVPLFHKIFPNVPIGISDRDFQLLNGNFSLLSDEAKNKIKGGFSKESIHIDFTFKKNKYNNFHIIESPGHTPGSVSFFEEKSKILIAGDAFQIRGGVAVSGTLKIFFPFPALATWDYQTALNSAKILKELAPNVLAVGHGKMIIDPIQNITVAISEAERHID